MICSTQVDARNSTKTHLLGLSLALTLASCGGGGSGGVAPGVSQPTVAHLSNAAIIFTVHVPFTTTSGSKGRSPKYISSAIQSVAFRLLAVAPNGGGTYTGSLPVDTLVPISIASGNCIDDGGGDKTCTVASTAPAAATDTWVIYTFATATPTIGTTTPLSIFENYSLAVTSSGPNDAAVATAGVPATLAFSPDRADNVPYNFTLGGTGSLTTSVAAVDIGGATLIGPESFASANGTPEIVTFGGCDSHLTPTPATFSGTSPTALAAYNPIKVAYDGLAPTGTTLHCTATTTGLIAQFSVNLVTSNGSINWSVQ